MRPASLEEAQNLTRVHACDVPPVLQRDFFRSLLAAYRPDEVRQQLGGAPLGSLRVEAMSNRHLLVWGNIEV